MSDTPTSDETRREFLQTSQWFWSAEDDKQVEEILSK